MNLVQDRRAPAVDDETLVSDEGRTAILGRAVAKFEAEGWALETKQDVNRVLIGKNRFRQVLCRKTWGIRNRREVVEVDKQGNVGIRPV